MHQVRGSVSQKQALKFARSRVNLPFLTSYGWKFYKPWKCSDPFGPTTEITRLNKHEIYQIRADYVASVALHYMDFDHFETEIAELEIDRLTHNNLYGDFIPADKLLLEGIRAINAFNTNYKEG